MNFKVKCFLILVVTSIAISNVFAAKRYWISAVTSNWNTTANWSATSGGAGGSSVPGSSDTAYFDGSGVGNCTIDANVNVKRFEMQSGYTGTVSQGTYTITFGSSGAVFSGGTFSGGSASIVSSGAFTVSGSAFTSTSSTFSVSANFTISSGSFTHNNGIVSLTATSTLTISSTGGVTFYDLYFEPTAANATFTITSTTPITVSHKFLFGGNKGIALNTGTINVTGDITINNTVAQTAGTALININGTGKQTFKGNNVLQTGMLPKITINKSDTLVLVDTISVEGNWTYTSGVINSGSSLVYFITTASLGTLTISGTHSLNNILFYGPNNPTYVIASGTTLTAKGSMSMSGGATINTGTINVNGDIKITNTGAGGGGTATIVANGTGSQTFSGNSIAGTAKLPNITINKSSGTLTLQNTISPSKNWTWTAGTVNAGTSTIAFCGTGTITGKQTFYNLNFESGSTTTLVASDTIKCTNNLSFNGSSAISVNTGVIEAKGNITVTNTSTSTSAGGSATILINGTVRQTLTGSGTAGAGYLPKIEINKPSETLVLASVISCARDWIYVAGTVDATSNSSQVVFIGNYNLDGEGTSSTMQFNKIVIGANTRTLTGNLNLRSNLNLQAGTTLSAGTYNITIGGDWKQSGSTSTFSATTGTVTFDGSNYVEIIRNSGASTATFPKLAVNKSGGSIKLNSPVSVTNSLTLTKGKIKALSTVPAPYHLELADNATCTGGSDTAYVHGTMRKVGNDAFTFPLGDTSLSTGAYHPLSISAPSVATDNFEGSYVASQQTQGSTLVDSLEAISTCEYWKLDRITGSSNVQITLGWNSNICGATNYNDLRVAAWDGAKWSDQGANNLTPNGVQGLISGAGPVALPFPIYFTLGITKAKGNYVTLHKQVDGGFYTVKNRSLLFKFEDEYANLNHTLNIKIWNSSHSDIYPTLTTNSHLSKIGDNRFKLDLFTSGLIPVSTGDYLMEVTNEKNEKQYLKFKIQ